MANVLKTEVDEQATEQDKIDKYPQIFFTSEYVDNSYYEIESYLNAPTDPDDPTQNYLFLRFFDGFSKPRLKCNGTDQEAAHFEFISDDENGTDSDSDSDNQNDYDK